jgi:hypothetical protein
MTQFQAIAILMPVFALVIMVAVGRWTNISIGLQVISQLSQTLRKALSDEANYPRLR